MRLALREFNHADQMRFAYVSGDRNPMHLDSLQARRTQAGAPVVHGIHLLLWALDSLAAAQLGLPPLRGFRIQMNRFVYLGEPVEVVLVQQSSTGVRLRLQVGGGSRSEIAIRFGDAAGDCAVWSASSLDSETILTDPLRLTMDEIAGRAGRLPLVMEPDDAAAMFPSALQWIGFQRIAALAATTYLVGMICPGLHSIYSELKVETCPDLPSQTGLAYRVTDTDIRFHAVEQEIVGGGITGTVSSFVRTPPVEQAAMASLKGLVSPHEFSGSVALIVGGSRGLGELTAKLVATGGGRAIVSWKSGKEDAERVAEEIRSAGGLCETVPYDASKSAPEQLAALVHTPSHAYYFATPAIFRPQAELFSPARLREFLAVYVDGFWDLALALQTLRPRLSIFYPSSVSVTERPKGMTDYTMAKAAGEVLGADMNSFLAPMHVTVSRLPRLPTDQTATISDVESADPIATMLTIVREVQSWPR